MNEESFKRYYKKWIQSIANDPRTNAQGIIEHLQKHAYEEITSMKEWIASFENLLEILKVMTCNQSDNTDVKIQRLNSKYLSDPDEYTGPPDA